MIKPILAGALTALCFCASGVRAYDLPQPPGNDRVYFEADNSSYDKGKDELHLEGHALVLEYGLNPSSGPVKITKGEDLYIFPSSHVFTSSGAVVMEDKGGAIFGYDARFDWESKIGGMNNVNADYHPWRIIRAKRMESRKGGTYVFKSGRVTSCNFPDEHYSFGFSRMHVTPDDRMWGLNVFFYLGKIPVFYLPFMYRPLGKDAAWVTYLEPGYDKRGGAFLKTTIYHRYSKTITSRLFLDYYSKIGVGTGAEMSWNNSKNFNGSIAAYRIRDNGIDRWGLYGGYWKEVGRDNTCPTCSGTIYYSQGQMRMVSDPYFNNDYFRDNPYAVSPDRESSAAVVRQGKITTTRLSVLTRSQAMAVGDSTRYVTTYESFPRLDFSASNVPVPGLRGIVNSFTAYVNRAQYTNWDYYQQSAYAQWMMSKSVPIVKHLSLLPSIYYDQTVTVHPRKADGTEDINQWIGAYGTSWVLRYDSLIGTLDTAYTYQRRLSPNSLNVETAADDAGVNTNQMTTQLFMRPNRFFYFKTGTGYDFRFVNGTSLDADQRLMPIASEMLYTPHEKMSVFARNYYRVRDGNQAFVFQADYGGLEENGFSLGLANYKSYNNSNSVDTSTPAFNMGPGAYILSPTIRWVPKNTTWRLDLGLGFYAYTTGGMNFKTFCLYEKNITLYKIFHDFFTQWYVKIRPGVETVGFLANLRFNDPMPRRVSPEEEQRFGNGWGYAGAKMP